MAAGAAMAGWGLFAKLLGVPVVGEMRYVDLHLGGKELAITIIVLMALATLCSPLPGRGRPFSMLCAGAALGAGHRFISRAIYRATMDQLEQLGPEALALLEKRQAMSGLWALDLGLALWLLSARLLR